METNAGIRIAGGERTPRRRAAVMMEVVLVLPFFLFIFLGVMRLSDAFRQKIGNRVASRHVGEARVYLTGAQHAKHFKAPVLARQHLRGRTLTFTSAPSPSVIDKGADEAAVFAAMAKAIAKSKSFALAAMAVNFFFSKENSGIFANTVQSQLPAMAMWPLDPNLSNTYYIERGTWDYHELGYPGIWGVRVAILEGLLGGKKPKGSATEFDSTVGGLNRQSEQQRTDHGGKVRDQAGRWQQR